MHHRGGARPRTPLPAGFWPIWTTVALDLVGFGIVVPILGLYAERYGASPTTVGLLFAAFSAAQFVCAPLLGRLSDRVGRKPVIIVSLLGTAVGSFLTGVAGSLWLLFAGRIIDGASGASVSVAHAAVTDLAEPRERPRLLGLLGAAFGLGFVLGPALGGLASLGGPHVPFFVAAAVALVNAGVAVVRVPETRRMDRRFAGESPGEGREANGLVGGLPAPATSSPMSAGVDEPSADRDVATAALERAHRRRSLRVLALTMFLATAAFSGFEATFALLGQERFDWTEGSVAAVFVLIGVALVVVQGGLIGPIVARFGQLPTLRAALVLNAAGLLLLAGATRWPLLIPALGCLVLGQGLATPTIATLVSERAHDERRGQALGFQQSAGALARIVGPAVAGLLFQHVGIPWPYLVGAAGMGLALAVLATRLPAGDEPGPLPARPAAPPAPLAPTAPAARTAPTSTPSPPVTPREVRSAP